MFVATPVQLWHRHSIPEMITRAGKAHVIKQDRADGIVISKAGIATDKCSICSHHYTAYTWNECKPDIRPSFTFISLVPARKEPLLQVSHFLFSNKSPPVTAL
ncbi:MAG: hypothetical protein DI535_07035 [Citrobacter freundii]|nr:MAG: hypothetical protein DI535_07035 [Citrobacter freundii]